MVVASELLSLRQTAQQLDLDYSTVQRAAASGELHGARIGSDVLVAPAEVRRFRALPRVRGRPFGARTSWEIIGQLAEGEVTRGSDPDEVAARVRLGRARRVVGYVHPASLQRIPDLSHLLSGHALLGDHPDLRGEVTDGTDLVDVYVSVKGHEELVSSLNVTDRGHDYNVVMHVVDDMIELPTEPPLPLIALDLIESPDPRLRGLGNDLWRRPWR